MQLDDVVRQPQHYFFNPKYFDFFQPLRKLFLPKVENGVVEIDNTFDYTFISIQSLAPFEVKVGEATYFTHKGGSIGKCTILRMILRGPIKILTTGPIEIWSYFVKSDAFGYTDQPYNVMLTESDFIYHNVGDTVIRHHQGRYEKVGRRELIVKIFEIFDAPIPVFLEKDDIYEMRDLIA